MTVETMKTLEEIRKIREEKRKDILVFFLFFVL